MKDDKDLKAIFVERLNVAIDKKGIKPFELAEASGISKARISQYMNGVYMPKSKGTYAIAKALGIDERWLIGIDVPMEKADKRQSVLSTEGVQRRFGAFSAACFRKSH